MTKLKTLKDLPNDKRGGSFVRIEDLKQEAIKWMKHRVWDTQHDADIFVDFFNLTEDDLK